MRYFNESHSIRIKYASYYGIGIPENIITKIPTYNQYLRHFESIVSLTSRLEIITVTCRIE